MAREAPGRVSGGPPVQVDGALDSIRSRLERPIGEATGLPGEWYTAAEFARLEGRRLWDRTWVCAGFVHELARAGDVVPVTVADRPLLFTRNPAGDIRCWLNRCPHRGTRLVDAPLRDQTVIRCPYHAWSFDMDGRLRTTPHFGGYRRHDADGFDPGAHGLTPVRTARWQQWLFVNPDGEAPAFEDHVSRFAAHLEEYDLAKLVHRETARFEIRGNWKIVEENFLETLHLPPVHVRLSEYAPFQEHDVVVDGPCLGTVIATGLPASWSDDPLPRFAGIPADSRTAKNLALFPNFKLVIGPDHACSMVELPDGPALTRQRWDFYFVGEEAAREMRYEPARRAIIEFFVQTNREDVGIIEAVHIGRAAPGYDGGVMSAAWEAAVHHFQRLVLDHVAGSETAPDSALHAPGRVLRP